MRSRISLITGILCLFFLASCEKETKEVVGIKYEPNTESSSKFEPKNGKVLLFVRQELESIGGANGFKDGYFDYFPAPGGFTTYTGFRGNGLSGLITTDDWGDGPDNITIL